MVTYTRVEIFSDGTSEDNREREVERLPRARYPVPRRQEVPHDDAEAMRQKAWQEMIEGMTPEQIKKLVQEMVREMHAHG
jgi:hypothetical protein